MEDNQKQAGNQQKEPNINGVANQLSINNSENKDNQVDPNSNAQVTKNPELSKDNHQLYNQSQNVNLPQNNNNNIQNSMNSQSQQPPIEERNDLNDNNLNNMEMNMEQFRQYNEQIMQNRYMPKMPIEYLEQSKNIYDYETDKNLYGIAFQNGNCPRMAISSLEKSLNNKIEILELIENDLAKVHELQLEYPCTKLLWSPNRNANSILAASSDCIKLYNYSEEDHSLKSYQTLFNKKSKYCGVLTSFDWNTVNDSLLGTASVDTTCTIWDLNKASIKTQLIAHDKEVFDIQFGNDENTFISGGADGSVRLFDLRALNHSTIIYETKGSTPINKLALNLKNPNLIAALSLDKKFIYIFDSRANANVSMDELSLHKEAVTGIVWAPDNPSQLCSVSEDYSVIISNIYNDDQMSQNTNVSYTAPSPINNVDWCKTFPEWIGITFQKRVQLLRK
jgi:WD repeat-containing protein 68